MKNSSHKKLTYRPEIDGLRAIAVSVVLLHHAKLAMPGGFVGVDVFFVISGFLITSLILKDYKSSAGFSIVSFWERRVRRIFPALVFVIIVTAVAGWFCLLPSDFLDLGKSVVAQSVFASNFYFWDTSGYFESSASIKPLLHTWSLAVEEQFYLLLPLLFLFRSFWSRKSLRWLFGTVIVLSLALSVIQANRAPDTGFYLLPSRAWELLAGAMLALLPVRAQLPKWIAELVGWSGLISIGLACLLYTHSTAFPGAAALLPVLGTVSIIWSTGLSAEPNILCRVLSLKPLVFVGKISYSLYLWHWPILVYAIYWRDDHIISWPYRLALLGLSFVLAIVSWKFVETPFRTRKVFPARKGVLGFGFVSLLLCVVGGGFVIFNEGCSKRFSEAVVNADSASMHYEYDWIGPNKGWTADVEWAAAGDFPTVGVRDRGSVSRVQCLLWGDSHAMAVRPAFDQLAKQYNVQVQFAAHPATCPVVGYESFDNNSLKEDSLAWSQSIVEHVKKSGVSNVVLAANWPIYYGPHRELSAEVFAAMLADTTLALRNVGCQVWILKRVPKQRKVYRIGIAKAILQRKPTNMGLPKSLYLEYAQQEDEILAPSLNRGARILDPSLIFYSGVEKCFIEVDGSPLYFDYHHVTTDGAFFLKPLFAPIFQDPMETVE